MEQTASGSDRAQDCTVGLEHGEQHPTDLDELGGSDRRGAVMRWEDHGRCVDRDGGLSLFFAENTSRAKAFCGVCPAWRDCLNHGLAEGYGVWGGLGDSERRRLRRLLARLEANPADPQTARDVRLLVVDAGFAPERLSAVLGVDSQTVRAWAEVGRRPRRRAKAASAVSSTTTQGHEVPPPKSMPSACLAGDGS